MTVNEKKNNRNNDTQVLTDFRQIHSANKYAIEQVYKIMEQMFNNLLNQPITFTAISVKLTQPIFLRSV